MIGGLKIVIVAEQPPPHWTRPRCPVDVPVGRRRAWKRKNPPRFVVPVQLMDVTSYYRAGDTLYCRQAAYSALKRMLAIQEMQRDPRMA